MFDFIYNLVWRFGEGMVPDTPPLSGGSKLNNSTGGVDFFSGTPVYGEMI